MIRFAALAWVLLCGVALGEDQPVSSALPIDHFTRHDEFGTVKISPDGEFLALTTGAYGRGMLAFVNLAQKKVIPGIRVEGTHEIHDFHWVSSTRVIYMRAQHWPGRAYPSATAEIFAIDRDGGGGGWIHGWRPGVYDETLRPPGYYAAPTLLSALEKDDQNILVSELPYTSGGGWRWGNPDAKPRIVRLNVYDGRTQFLAMAPLRNADILVDSKDEVRVAVGLDDQFEHAVSLRPSVNSPWVDLRLPGFRRDSLKPLRVGADDRSMLFSAVREGETFAALYRLDLKTHAIEKLHAFEGSEVSGLVADFDNREIVGVRGYADRPLHHWLRPDDPVAKLHLALQRAFADQSVAITSVTDDGRRAIVFVSSDTNPGDYYLFDTRTRKADFLRAARAWIDPRQMRAKQPIKLMARDGLELHGYLTLPEGNGPHPLVVLPHDGPHDRRDKWEFEWEVQLLAHRGYAVLQINYRGSAGYGIDFQTAGHRQWGARMQDDLTDATRWAIAQTIAPADRVCIFGAGYGGYAALMGITREPDLYRCAISHSGFYDLTLLETSGDIRYLGAGKSYLNKTVGDDPADLQARSPVYGAARVQAPVLLIHSDADREQAEPMKAALERNAKAFEWIALNREGPGSFHDERTRREVYERVLLFLDKHLKGASTAPQQTAQQP